MIRYAMLSVALLIAVPATAQDQVPFPLSSAVDEPLPPAVDSRTSPQDFDLARKKVLECEGEQFVFAWGGGAKPTKVTLCSKKDATADELVHMLDDAAAKLEQTDGIAEDRRVAIVQQIRAKISQLKAVSEAALAPGAEPPPAAAQLPVTPSEPVARRTIAPAVSQTTAAVAKPVLATKPRLSFECYNPREMGSGGPCTMLVHDTRLTVKAVEPLAGGASLRFVRNGENRAEIALEQLRKNQSVQLTLPRAVCAGVFKSKTKIEVVRGGQVVDSVGPFLLRC